MSLKANSKLKITHDIKTIPLKSLSNPMLKTLQVPSNTNKKTTSKLKSYRCIGHPSTTNIFIKGNQTPVKIISIMPKSVKTRNSCMIQEALQSKEWLSKARESISQELSLFINSSNCLKVETPLNAVTYKYYIGKGNNSALVKKCLSTRPWWVSVDEDQISSANLVWVQFKNNEHFYLMPTAYERLKTIDHSLQGKSVVCNALYEDMTNSLKNVDISKLGYDLITKSKFYIAYEINYRIDPVSNRVQNKLEHNFHLSDKKFLYSNMKEYYDSIGDNVFNYLPLTFHIEKDLKDLQHFINAFNEMQNKLWIVKPGENTNRGNGIFVSNDLSKILTEVSNNSLLNESQHTFIIQKYIEKPLLINKRKFDIRLYTLVTSVNGVIQAYFYEEGYLRTACKVYNANDLDNKFIHLTNDAIQNKSEEYGKFENGNKLSYQDFQRYLDAKKIAVNFKAEIIPKIKNIVQDTIKATKNKLNKDRRLLGFEVWSS